MRLKKYFAFLLAQCGQYSEDSMTSQTLMSHEDRWLLILSVKKKKDKRDLYVCMYACVVLYDYVVKTNKVLVYC